MEQVHVTLVEKNPGSLRARREDGESSASWPGHWRGTEYHLNHSLTCSEPSTAHSQSNHSPPVLPPGSETWSNYGLHLHNLLSIYLNLLSFYPLNQKNKALFPSKQWVLRNKQDQECGKSLHHEDVTTLPSCGSTVTGNLLLQIKLPMC